MNHRMITDCKNAVDFKSFHYSQEISKLEEHQSEKNKTKKRFMFVK